MSDDALQIDTTSGVARCGHCLRALTLQQWTPTSGRVFCDACGRHLDIATPPPAAGAGEACGDCGGQGAIVGRRRCPTCDGTGARGAKGGG